jgi:hypothetical protein
MPDRYHAEKLKATRPGIWNRWIPPLLRCFSFVQVLERLAYGVLTYFLNPAVSYVAVDRKAAEILVCIKTPNLMHIIFTHP